MAARKKSKKTGSTKKTAKGKAKAAPRSKAPASKAKAAKKKAATKKVATKAKAAPKAAKAAPKKAKAAAAPKAAKAAPKKAKAAPAPKAAKAAPVSRRDATGHLNPKYAADLRAKSRESRDDGLAEDTAFLRKSRAHDTLAEELGEEAVGAMTSGEDQGDRLTDLEVEEEQGGPFVTTSGREEFARGTDRSNPQSATREPFPKT